MTCLRYPIPRINRSISTAQAIAFGVLASVFGSAVTTGVRADERAPAGSKTVRFNRDIRPILADKCFKCHGPDAGERKGKLRLDNARTAVLPAASGSAAIVPGNLDDSELYHAASTSTDADEADAAAQERQRLSRTPRSASSRRGSKRGRNISRALGVFAGPSSRPAPADRKERSLVPYPDRPIHPGPAGSRGTQASTRGRQGDLDTATQPSTWSACHAGDSASRCRLSRPNAACRGTTTSWS